MALAEGYAPGTPCVSGPNSGAMGVHLINGALLGKEIDAETPEALIYEPSPNGHMRLVGVEIITFASDWVDEVPVLDGHLLHYVGAPNRYGIPAFYEIHVWAWRNNPDGPSPTGTLASPARGSLCREAAAEGSPAGDPSCPRRLIDYRQLDRGRLRRRRARSGASPSGSSRAART